MNKAFDLYISALRNKDTTREGFRRAAEQITSLLAHQVMDHLKTQSYTVETPLASTQGVRCSTPIVLVPILRSGITMVRQFLYYFPEATIGVVGFKRDEKTAQAKQYYANFPPMSDDHQIIILDPMIATGGTAVGTLNLLKNKGIKQERIIYVSMVSAPEGIAHIKNSYPAITILVAAHDQKLNKEKFILPGIGDFGDRFFGTLD